MLCLIHPPMRKNTSRLFSPVILALLCITALADSITLKNGEKIDGKITGETANDVTVEVKVSAGISDTRTIPKADIAKLDKEQPDTVAWQQLKNLKLGPNSLPAASYDQVINALNNFTTQFPTSPHAADAQKLAADFDAEKKRIASGEVKLNEKWLSKEE